MSTLNDGVPGRINESDFFLGLPSPQYENNGIGFVADLPNDFIGERFPAAALVRKGFASPQRQNRVEHQDALFCPGQQASVVGRWKA